MRSRIRTFRNMILPVTILAALLFLLVGCLYIPTAEQVDLKGAKKDFRQLVGKKNSLIAVGRITRQEIQSLLGRPSVSSDNDRVRVYFLTSKQGIWIQPQCFEAFAASQTLDVLALRFDEKGNLEHLQIVTQDYARRLGLHLLAEMDEPSIYHHAIDRVLRDVDKENNATEWDNPMQVRKNDGGQP